MLLLFVIEALLARLNSANFWVFVFYSKWKLPQRKVVFVLAYLLQYLKVFDFCSRHLHSENKKSLHRQ